MYHEPGGADTSHRQPNDYASLIGRNCRRNFGGAVAEKVSMQVLPRARETESDDDDQPSNRAENAVEYEPAPRPLLRLRCFACAGTGELWVTDATCPGGRSARCVACHGTGRVEVK